MSDLATSQRILLNRSHVYRIRLTTYTTLILQTAYHLRGYRPVLTVHKELFESGSTGAAMFLARNANIHRVCMGLLANEAINIASAFLSCAAQG